MNLNSNWPAIVEQAMKDRPNARLLDLTPYGAPGILKIAQSDDRSGPQLALRSLIGFCLGMRHTMCPQDRLLFEARRLQELASQNIAVPAVLAQGPNWLVMEKLDSPWLSAFKSENDEQQLSRLTQSFVELGKLHKAGEWHGGAQLRNLMWHDGQTYRIDFEETALLGLALSSRQRFDLLILLVDVVRHCPKTAIQAPSFTRFLEAYQENGGGIGHCRILTRWSKLFYWLTLPLRPLGTILGRDGKTVLDFLAAMRSQ